MKKQNKKLIWILIGSVITTLIASTAWIFHDYFNTDTSTKDKTVGIGEVRPITKPLVISYENRISEAQKLIENQYFSEATLELSEAIKLKPDYIEPYLLLGNIYLQENTLDKLDNLISKLKNTFPNDPQILILQTRKWVNQEKFSEIMASLADVENLPFELQFYKAVLLTLQNNHDTSRKILKKLEKLPVTPKDALLNKKGQKSPSLKNVKKTIRPEVLKKVREFRIVYEEFDEFKEGKNAHLFAKFSKILIENQEIILAKKFADMAIKEDIQYIDAWILRGYSQFLNKDYKNAIKDFHHAYELDPIRPEVHYFMALALVEEGQLDEAALFFEKSLEYDFEFSEEVRWKLIDILAKQGKYDEVLKLYKQLLNYKTDPKKFASAVHTAVDILNKPEVALEFTEILIKKNPDDLFSLNIHAWALIANKEFLAAEKILNKAQKQDPKNPRTYLNLGLLYEEMKNTEKAMAMYQKSYQLGKDKKESSSLVNLAADKYNELVAASNKPVRPRRIQRLEHSP